MRHGNVAQFMKRVIQKKKILITGCSSGIGRDLVGELLNAGHIVIASMRQTENRRNIFLKELTKYPDQIFVQELDVCKDLDRKNTAELINSKFSGHLDGLINNAGFGVFGALEDISEEQIRLQMEVNFFGLTLLCKELLPALRKAGGRIINISSVLGYSALPLSSMYCASKYAIEGLSEALYHELKPFNVKVCLLEPGGHKTNFRENMLLAKDSSSEESSYFPYTKNYCLMLEKKINKEGTSANNISKKVLKLLNSSSPPLRTPSGFDAVSVYWLKKLLPERIFLMLVGLISRRLYYRDT